MDLPFRRIMIFGLPGSGKSTFANRLGKAMGIPVYHLDSFFFVENWKERNYAEFMHRQRECVERPEWIIEGNARRSLEVRYAKADLALYFCPNRLLCLWRMSKRLFQSDPAIQDRAKGCTKSMRWRLIRYLWHFDAYIRPEIQRLCTEYPSISFRRLSTTREVEKVFEMCTQGVERR